MNPRLPVLLTAILCSCGSTKPGPAKEEEKKIAPEGPQLVGRIASIPADKRFVLIQSYGPWKMESGRILTTRGPEDRTANLKLTGETLGEFAAADLQSGTVEPGDAVYSQHVAKPSLPLVPTASVEPIPAIDPNVKKNN